MDTEGDSEPQPLHAPRAGALRAPEVREAGPTAEPTQPAREEASSEPDEQVGMSSAIYYTLRLARTAGRVLLAWALASAGLAIWSPGLVTGLDASAVIQVLAPSSVALFALVLASVFVAAQTAVSLYGARMALAISSDEQILACLLRLGLVLLASLGAVVAVRSDGSTVALVSAFLIVLTVTLAVEAMRALNDLGVALNYATAPRLGAERLRVRVLGQMEAGLFNNAPWMAGALTGMLQSGLRRGDGVGVLAVAECVEELHGLWVIEASERSAWRQPSINGWAARRGWLTGELSSGVARAGEEALASGASSAETDRFSEALGTLALQATEQGFHEESQVAVDELTLLGTTVHQVSSSAVNLSAQPAWWLARVEASAEESASELGHLALANWALCVANVYQRFQRHHPLYQSCLAELGPAPDWDGARERVCTESWQAQWVNQLYGSHAFVLHVIDVAEANTRGKEGPLSEEVFAQPADAVAPGPVTRFLSRSAAKVVAATLAELGRLDLPSGPDYPPPGPIAGGAPRSP